MSFSLTDFRSNLVYGGARPNLYRVEIINPVDGSADLRVPFLVKAASLPAWTQGKIPVAYMGRFVNIPGDREVADWNVTVYNDEDFLIRNALENWSNKINTQVSNERAYPDEVKSQAQVSQLARDGRVLRTYTFHGIFPIDVAAIELGFDTQNTIEEFAVTFSVDDFVVDGGSTGRVTT